MLYEWDFDSDGTYDATGVTATHAYSQFGQYTVTLRVTDDNVPARTDTATSLMDISLGNQAPTADPNGPYLIDVGDDLMLDGSGSWDPDEGEGDSIVSYQWDLGGDGSYEYSGEMVTVPWADLAGLPGGGVAHTVTLRVTDSFGAADTADTELRIFTNEPVAQFTANPNPALTGQPISFDASGSSHGRPDRSIVLYEWDFESDGTYDATGVTVSHAYSQFGQYTVTLRVADDNVPARNDTATLGVVINESNRPPTANDDTATTDEDTPVVVDVLANDSDPDGDPLRIGSYEQPEHGTVAEAPDGKLLYTPDADYNGPDRFEYETLDGKGGDATAMVHITVRPVNDPPTAGDDQAATDEDTDVRIEILANDSDPENDPLTVRLPAQKKGNGLLTDNGDGTVTFSPNGDFDWLGVGKTTKREFSYSIDDGHGGTDDALITVTITGVNDPPTAVDDQAGTDEDTPVTVAVPGVLGNDTDPENDPLTVSTHDATSAAGGLVTVNPDGSFTYDPNGMFESLAEGATAADTFGYTTSDPSGATDTATVTVTVHGVNDAPVAQDGAFHVVQDGSYSSTLNGLDVDTGDTTTFSIEAAPAHGTLTSVDANTGAYTYEPDFGYTGPDSFTFRVTDGMAVSNVATMTITVAAAHPWEDRVIDDGDDGYSEIGTVWTRSYSAGYDGDYRQSAEGPGVGDSKALWTFQNVPLGHYGVYATWKSSMTWSRATNAPYTIYDGNDSQLTQRIDMRSAPNDETFFRTSWEKLGELDIVNGSLTVELGDNADGKVIADAIYVTYVGPAYAPSIGSFDVQPELAASGAELTLTASDVTATDATIDAVAFYRDVDDNGALDTTVDESVGTDNDSVGGWSVRYLTVGLPAGTHTYFAQAVDSEGRPGHVAVASGKLIDSAAGLIIDNGDVGYAEVGPDWTTSHSAGYQGDYAQSAEGSGTGQNVATWSIGGLSDGQYEVLVTWKPSPSSRFRRATNALYTVRNNGTDLETAPVNMKYRPADTYKHGAWWHSLGYYDITTGTIMVQLTDAANGKVIADAVYIRRFGDAFPPGIGSLTVEPELVPIGSEIVVMANDVRATAASIAEVAFYRDVNGNRTIDATIDEWIGADTDPADGWSVRYSTVGLSAGVYDYLAQAVDSQGRPSHVAVASGRLIDPAASLIIDNGDVGYTEVGPDWTTSYSAGYRGDYAQSAEGAGLGDNIATWSIGGLTPGAHQVLVTWKPSNSWSRASNAPFTVFDGDANLGTTRIDMHHAPAGPTVYGASWQSLGVYEITTGVLTVELSDAADGKVIADAVYIVRL